VPEQERQVAEHLQADRDPCVPIEPWPNKEGLYSPSLLDQAVASAGLVEVESVRVHGFCAARRCASSPTPPDDFFVAAAAGSN
jgi:hypothetical protein